MRNTLERLRTEEDAATIVEYAILAAIVGVALIGTLSIFSNSVRAMLNRAAQAIGIG